MYIYIIYVHSPGISISNVDYYYIYSYFVVTNQYFQERIKAMVGRTFDSDRLSITAN